MPVSWNNLSKNQKWIYALTGLMGLSVIAITLPWVQSDADFWWHLADGRYIFTNHSLPYAAPWVFGVLVAKHWTLAEWGSELWMYLAGIKLTLVIYLLMVMAIAGVGLLRLWNFGIRKLVVYALMPMFMVILLLPALAPRDELQSTSIVVLTALMLEFTMSKRNFWYPLMPILFFLGVNLHPSFFIGVGLWGVTLLYWYFSLHHARVPLVTRVAFQKSLKWFGVSILATLINPYTYHVWGYFLATLHGGVLAIEEWQSPNFHWPDLIPLALFIALIPFAWQKLNGVYRLWIMACIPATLYSARNLQITAALIVPIVIMGWCAAYQNGTWAKTNIGKVKINGLVSWGLITVIVVCLACFKVGVEIQHPFKGVSQPTGVSTWLKEHHIVHKKLFVTYASNGYFIYHNPQNKVWLFGDVALAGSKTLTEYQAITNLSPFWKKDLLNIAPNYIIDTTNAPLVLMLQASSDHFTKVFDSSGWVVYKVINN